MIPKILHQYHQGAPLPALYQQWQDELVALHPEWEFRLWDYESAKDIIPQERLNEHDPARHNEIGDLCEFYVMHKIGGVFLDTDVQILKPLDPLTDLPGWVPFTACPVDGLGVTNFACGFPPGHPFIDRVLDRLPNCAGKRMGSLPQHVYADYTGIDVVPLPPLLLSPYPPSRAVKEDRMDTITPETYGHHDHQASWVRSSVRIGRMFTRYGSDKDTDYSYGPVYEQILGTLKERGHIDILEIGVKRGNSIRAWGNWKELARVGGHLIGVDISQEETTQHVRDNYSLVIGDSKTVSLPQKFDLIIDDGDHSPGSQVATKANLWASLKPGGAYVIEDIYVDDEGQFDYPDAKNTYLDLQAERPGREDNRLHISWKEN